MTATLSVTTTCFSAEPPGPPATEAVLEVLADGTVVGTFQMLSLTPEAVADGLPHDMAVVVQTIVDSRQPGDDRDVHLLTLATLHPGADVDDVLSCAWSSLTSRLDGVLAVVDTGGPVPGTPHPWASPQGLDVLPVLATPVGPLHRHVLDDRG